MSRVIAVIQARYNSERLAGKVLADLAGRPLLWHVVTRVAQAKTLTGFVVATGNIPANDGIRALCQAEGWPCYSGSEEDVLDRFYQAAKWILADVIVRITGDCPLHSAEEINRLVRFFHNHCFEYACNTEPPMLPDGLDAEVMGISALGLAHQMAALQSDREHVTPWLRRNLPAHRWGSLWRSPDMSRWRLCVDEPVDLGIIRRIFAALGSDCTWQEAVRFLEAWPDLAAINQNTERSARYVRQVAGEKEVS